MWLKYIRLDLSSIFAVQRARKKMLDTLLKQQESLFTDKLRNVKPFTASLQILTNATPRFFKSRPVQFSIRDAVSQELNHLEKQRMISSVSTSQWAAPIVIVPKKNGRYRIFSDHKVTVNQALDVEEYLLPTPEELFSTLSGGRVFSMLDLCCRHISKFQGMRHQSLT